MSFFFAASVLLYIIHSHPCQRRGTLSGVGINQAPHCALSDAQFLQPQIKKRFWTQLMLTAEVLHLGTLQDKTRTLRHCRSGCTPSPTSSTGGRVEQGPTGCQHLHPGKTNRPSAWLAASPPLTAPKDTADRTLCECLSLVQNKGDAPSAAGLCALPR